MQKIIKTRQLFTLLLLTIILSNCKTDNPFVGCSDCSTITSFSFLASKNSAYLTADATGIINIDKSIVIQLPPKSNLTKLIANFTFEGKEVRINGILQTSAVTVRDFSNPIIYSVKAQNGATTNYTVTATLLKGTENAITAFKLKIANNKGLPEDIAFVIDEPKAEITGTILRWIDSETPSKLVADFETKGKSVTINGTDQLSGITINDFKEPLHYTVTAENGTEKDYKLRIICPQINASLPIIRMNADAPIVSGDVYVKANLQLIGNGITEGIWNSYANGKKIDIRLRGNSTMWLPKQPYRIKFPEKFSPLGLNHAKEKSWVLLANDADKTLIRNAVAFKAAKIMNDDAAINRFIPSTVYVDLYLDGEYKGNYQLTDQVEVATGRVNVASLKAADGNDPLKITGGYLLEIDGFGESEPLYFKTKLKNLIVTVKYPKDDDYDISQFDYIKDYFGNQAESALFSFDFTDPVNGWRKYFDEKTFIDYYIISEFTGNPDSWWSTYIFKHRNDPLLYFGPIWDFDIAFNNDKRLGDATRKLMATDAHDPKVWIQQFMKDDEFKKAVKLRWNSKKSELMTLAGYADQMVAKINLSQEANFKRWDIHIQKLSQGGVPPENYELGVKQLKDYMNARYTYLDAVFNSW